MVWYSRNTHAGSDIVSYCLTDPDRDVGAPLPFKSTALPFKSIQLPATLYNSVLVLQCAADAGCLTRGAGPLRSLLGADRLLRLQPCDPCFLTVRCRLSAVSCRRNVIASAVGRGPEGKVGGAIDVIASPALISFPHALQEMKEVAAVYAQV